MHFLRHLWISFLATGLCLSLLSTSAAANEHNRIFVTSVSGTGDLSSWADSMGLDGLEGADTICQARADAAGLSGTFVAWMSDSQDDAWCRVLGLSGKRSANCGLTEPPDTSALNGGWVRMDGKPFTTSLDELTAASGPRILYPFWFDEFANPVAVSTIYMTGTTATGVQSTLQSNCASFTSASGNAVGGRPNLHHTDWTEGSFPNCSLSNRLVCMQIDGKAAAPPSFARSGDRLAFLTASSGPGDLGQWPLAGANAGFAAADEICRASAAEPGLPRAEFFRAHIGGGGIQPVDRFDYPEGPFIRLDGVRYMDSLFDFEPSGSGSHSALNLTSAGNFVGSQSWLGFNLFTLDGSNCDDWTAGNSGASGHRWFNAMLGPTNQTMGSTALSCHFNMRLRCIEDSDLLFTDRFTAEPVLP